MKNIGFTVKSVNISKKKGTIKESTEFIELSEFGVVGDAHAGRWHRQVSLLAEESIQKAEDMADTCFPFGTFAENISTNGLDLNKTNILDRFVSSSAEMEVTQIGKKCHSKCAIGSKIGDCIMPKEGIFARVIKPGRIQSGDRFEYYPRVFKVAVITLSDRASAGEYKDLSGPAIKRFSKKWFADNRLNCSIEHHIIPDEKKQFTSLLQKTIDNNTDIIYTTGSTGIGERDIAPDVINDLIDKEIPGIMEHIRLKYGQIYPNALLSRSVAGIKERTMIFAMPGNPKAVKEYMDEIHSILFHSIMMLHGINKH